MFQKNAAAMASHTAYAHLATSEGGPSHPPPNSDHWPASLDRLRRLIWDSGNASIATAAFLYSWAAALVRPINPGMPVFEIVTMRSGISLGFSAAAAAQQGMHPLLGQRHNWPFLAMRGLVGAAAMDCFYHGITRLPLADAVSLLFVNPAITAALAALLLGEPFGRFTAAGCVLCMLGMVLVVHPPFLFGGHQEWSHQRAVGTAFALASALLAAGAYLSIRIIGK